MPPGKGEVSGPPLPEQFPLALLLLELALDDGGALLCSTFFFFESFIFQNRTGKTYICCSRDWRLSVIKGGLSDSQCKIFQSR